MDVKSTWILTWHRMDHVSWLLGLSTKTTSWRVGLTQNHREIMALWMVTTVWLFLFYHVWGPAWIAIYWNRSWLQGSGDYWAQPANIPPLHNFYEFFQDLTGCKLVAINLDRPVSYIYIFQVLAILFFHCNDNQPRTWALISKPVFQCRNIKKCNNEANASHVHHLGKLLQAYNRRSSFVPKG